MQLRLNVILFLLALTIGCGSNTSQPPANGSQSAAGSPGSATTTAGASNPTGPATAPPDAVAAKPRIDACALLTSSEIESVQGEAVKETKLTGQTTGGLSSSQCFYTLATFTKSVSLVLVQRGEGQGAAEPQEFWRETFHADRSEKRERDRKQREEKEEEGPPPQKIAGIGDEAFWTESRVGGVLFVLKGDAYLRISIGGPADQAGKMKRSKTLAEKVLPRL